MTRERPWELVSSINAGSTTACSVWPFPLAFLFPPTPKLPTPLSPWAINRPHLGLRIAEDIVISVPFPGSKSNCQPKGSNLNSQLIMHLMKSRSPQTQKWNPNFDYFIRRCDFSSTSWKCPRMPTFGNLHLLFEACPAGKASIDATRPKTPYLAHL